MLKIHAISYPQNINNMISYKLSIEGKRIWT